MDWIKTKYDRVILLAAGLLLIVSAIFVFLNSQAVSDIFASYFAPFNKDAKIKLVDIKPITGAKDTLASPFKWIPQEKKTLFVSDLYVLQKDGVLRPLTDATIFHPPVPNEWFKKYDIDLIAQDALEQDPDGDQFSNLEEWKGGTIPTDAKSHPLFTDKLRLKQYIRIPFRIIFKARDGQVMQINTVDLKQPSQFLKVGDKIAGTKFEIKKLDIKEGADSLGTPKDTSEATIRNVETNAEIILVLGIIADSPDTYALFKYLYDNTEFKVKRDGEFKLKPDDETTYKLVDISSSEAVITTPAGKKITIPK